MKYTTQKDAAMRGIITDKMREAAEYEGAGLEVIMERVASGKAVLPANKNHKNIVGRVVGEGFKTKINVNLGVSEDCCSLDKELEKVKMAIDMKADAIMDLSTFGNTSLFRQKVVEISPVMIGTVPVYDAIAKYGKKVEDITVDDFFEVVERHAAEGVDFQTIHAGLNRTAVERIHKNGRLTNIVSRGGSILFEWMSKKDRENPFYENYDRVLEICKKYDVTLSLGDGLRPGSLKDATDAAQIQELIILGELTKESWKENVQVMIEGPGHVPLNEIAANMIIEKKLCHGAPFYVLGPLVTDIAPGYDHITSAIGGAIAASAGADFLCYVTPAEHLRLPDLDDMKEGIIASRIAAHAADIAKGIKGAIEWDHEMSKARADLNWKKMIDLSIDPVKARRYRESSQPIDSDVCTMCGDLCAVKRCNEVLKK